MAEHTVPSPTPRTINELFAIAARRYRKPDAFSYKRGTEWVSVSHEQFIAQVRDARAGFLALGIQSGDRIGLLSENRLEWTVTDLAMLSCGGVTVPIYATLTGPQAAYILNDAGARALCVSTEKQLAKILEVIDELPNLEAIITFDPVAAKVPDNILLLSFNDLMNDGRMVGAGEGDFLAELEKAAQPDDLATLIYTSGTTGEPKGVMLTHYNIASNVVACMDRLPFLPEDVALSYLPLSHIYERTTMYALIYSGVSVYFAESVDAVAHNLREVKPTVMTSVPRIFEKILAKIEDEGEKAGGMKTKLFHWAMRVGKEFVRARNAGLEPSPLIQLQFDIAQSLVLSKIRDKIAPRLRFFASGGAALAEDISCAFGAIGMPILQGYGLTETSPVISSSSLDHNRFGTVGKPLPGIEVRIAEDGEVIVRGPNVMRGYYNRPQATAEVLRDGWFATGDIGCFDEDGYLKITDRKKDLFKTSGGKYIAPQPIENKLATSPLIVQAVVIGNDRKFPAALVVPNLDALKSYANQKGIKFSKDSDLLENPGIVKYIEAEIDRLTPDLAQYEKIKKVALLPGELTIEGGELTPTLKVKRRVVDSKYKDVIERLYAEKAAKAAGA